MESSTIHPTGNLRTRLFVLTDSPGVPIPALVATAYNGNSGALQAYRISAWN